MFKKTKKDEKKDEKIDWIPTMGGNYQAYVPQARIAGVWTNIKTVEAKDYGVPQPKHMGGINEMLGLYGYAQAMALAFSYKAHSDAVNYDRIEVRVQPYQVVYDLKARIIEESAE